MQSWYLQASVSPGNATNGTLTGDCDLGKNLPPEWPGSAIVPGLMSIGSLHVPKETAGLTTTADDHLDWDDIFHVSMVVEPVDGPWRSQCVVSRRAPSHEPGVFHPEAGFVRIVFALTGLVHWRQPDQ